MRPDLKAWTCAQCERTVLVPPEGDDGHLDTILRIREHWLGHMVDTLMHCSDEDLWGLSGDESKPEWYEDEQGVSRPCDKPVDSDDLAPVLAGIEELLRDDLPRAKRVWYPINPNGSFNREGD